jgi:DNA-binding CsgD family transcriptional regulator/PAS domain-containing protein
MPKKQTNAESVQQVKALKKDVAASRKLKTELMKVQAQLKQTKKRLNQEAEDRKRAEERYRFLYEFAPISIWDSDISKLKQYIERLRKRGVKNLGKYLRNHPEALADCASKIRIVDSNAAALEAFKATSKKQFANGLSKMFVGDSLEPFCEGVVAYAEGKDVFECEMPAQTFNGERRDFVLKWTVPSDDKDERARSLGSLLDISERKQMERELEAKNIKLEQMNAALQVLVSRREEDKNELEEKVLANVKDLAFPVLEGLRNCGLTSQQKAYVDVLESSLNEIISPFLRTLSTNYSRLTPTEIMVANFVKEGKSTKQIASMMNLSKRSVETYRTNLRRKLGIGNKKANLRTYLLTLK